MVAKKRSSKKESSSRSTEDLKLDVVLEKYNKAAGVTVVGPASEMDMTMEVVPTGNLMLDVATGIGGIALGKLYELCGDKASGKTTLCLSLERQHLKLLKKRVMHVDIERAMVGGTLDNFELRPYDERFIYNGESVAESVLSMVIEAVETGGLSLVVLDSIPAILPSGEINKTFDEAEMIGEKAKLLQRFILKLNPLLSAHNTTVIMINQLRTDIKKARSLPMANPMKSYGGKAVEYFPSCKITLTPKTSPKTPKYYNELGIKLSEPIKCTIGKNRLGLTCDLGKPSTLRLGFGFDVVYDLIDVADIACQLTTKGAWIYYNGNNVAQGQANFYTKLLEDKALRTDLAKSTLPLVGIKDVATYIKVIDDFVDRKKRLYDPGLIHFDVNTESDIVE